jgi:hypothetical protein
VLTGSITNAAPSAKLKLVENGKSQYVIATAGNQIPAEITASKELQAYISKSTGVTLPIIKESELKSGAPAIVVGQSSIARSAGIIPKGSEQWVIKTIGNKLVLTGGRPRGTLYAVYHFLEDNLGIRWWTIWDESVPKHGSIILTNINRSGQPKFSYREIFDCLIPWPKEFYARNRVNGEFSGIPIEYGGTVMYGPPSHVHTFNRYFPPEEYFEAHPEWFALSKGKRDPQGQLCLTNTELFDAWVAKMKGFIKTSYAAADQKGIERPAFFSISANDSLGGCECPNCKVIIDKESESGLSLMFVNKVAAEIQKEYPEILVDTLAYWFYVEAPKTIKPRDNVRIRLCDFIEDILHGINHKNNKDGLRRLKEWSKITKHLAIWKYGVIYSPNLPTPSMLYFSDDVKTYKKYGVEGVFFEFEYAMTTDMWDMKTWMSAKLYEDPDADSTKLVKEFTDGFYGPAGKYIREYLNVTHKALQKIPSSINFGGNISGYNFLTLDVVRKCSALFDKAEASVANNQTLLDRVQLARTSLDRTICYRYANLQKDFRKAGSKGEFGLSVSDSAIRAAAILRKMAGTRFANYPDSAKDAYDQATALDQYSYITKPASLSKQFASLPADTVFDYSPNAFRLVSTPKMTKDTEAAYGFAAMIDVSAAGKDTSRYMITKAQGMPMGTYNIQDKVESTPAMIFPDDIKPGYNFYKLGPVKFKPTEYFYLLWSWTIQLDLTTAMNNNPDQEYEVYASIKFDGPTFPKSDSTKPNSIWVDRIIVVQVKQK